MYSLLEKRRYISPYRISVGPCRCLLSMRPGPAAIPLALWRSLKCPHGMKIASAHSTRASAHSSRALLEAGRCHDAPTGLRSGRGQGCHICKYINIHMYKEGETHILYSDVPDHFNDNVKGFLKYKKSFIYQITFFTIIVTRWSIDKTNRLREHADDECAAFDQPQTKH